MRGDGEGVMGHRMRGMRFGVPELQTCLSYLFVRISLDDISHPHILVTLQQDTAFKTALDLADIVLETTQTCDLGLLYDRVITNQSRFGVAFHQSIQNHTAGYCADLWHAD